MNRKELHSAIANVLCDNGIRKEVSIKKHKFVITDDDNNKANFYVKGYDKGAPYTVKDVEVILDAMFAVIADALQRGERVFLRGFGTFSMTKLAPHRIKHPETGEMKIVEAHSKAKFRPGDDLKMAAGIYDANHTGDELEDPYDDYEDED